MAIARPTIARIPATINDVLTCKGGLATPCSQGPDI